MSSSKGESRMCWKTRAIRLLVICSLPVLLFGQSGSKLPDPFAPAPKASAVIPVSGPRQVSELPSPKRPEKWHQRRSSAKRSDNPCHERCEETKTLRRRFAIATTSSDQPIARAKAAALSELRAGLYCSQCHRTKTGDRKQRREFQWITSAA